MRHWILILGAVLVPIASVAEDIELEALPVPPELSEAGGVQDGVPIRPAVKKLRSGDTIMEEHRINGMLHAVKVIPAGAPPYYLLDRDGDGSLGSRDADLDRVSVPEWVIFRW